MADAPLFVVHVTNQEAAEAIREHIMMGYLLGNLYIYDAMLNLAKPNLKEQKYIEITIG